MSTVRRWWKRLLGSLAGSRGEERLIEELQAHEAMLVDEHLRRGLPPAEARRLARLALGSLDSVTERCRDQRGFPWLDALERDVRYALQGIRRHKGFTVATVACLALGIGATTTIFSLANAALFKPLPVSRPSELVVFRWTSETPDRVLPRATSGYNDYSLPYAAVRAFRERTEVLAGTFAFVPAGFDEVNVSVRTGSHRGTAAGEMVTGGYFRGLGVSTAVGRPIIDDDLRPEARNVVVLSHAYWTREFGGDPSLVGSEVFLNGLPFTVVGVAAAGFRGVDPRAAADLWVPLRDLATLRPWGLGRHDVQGSMFEEAGYFWCIIGGRLQPGVTESRALAELNPVFRAVIAGAAPAGTPAAALPRLALESGARGLGNLGTSLVRPLKVLMAAAGILLLIACVNVATLLLARADARQAEIGMRLALGASRARVIQQLLTEGVILALAGGAAGLALARFGSPLLLRLLARSRPSIAVDTSPDLAVLAFTAGVSLLTGVLFSLVPALRAVGANVASAIRKDARTAAPRLRMVRALVVAQMALCVVLLFGAGLFVRTLRSLDTQPLGFDSDHLLLFQLDTRRLDYDAARARHAYEQALQHVGRLPGVRSVSASGMALLSGWTNSSPTWVDSGTLPAGEQTTHWNTVGPNFFETLGIRTVLGHGLGWRELSGRQRVAVVNQAWVRRFMPTINPLGHRFCLSRKHVPAAEFEIVGVVEDAKYWEMRLDAPPTAYVPYTAMTEPPGRLWVTARTQGDALTLAGDVRKVMATIDPDLTPLNLRTQRHQIALSLGSERFFALVSAVFGLLAVILVASGLFGTLAFAVGRRQREIGIRLALGARPSSVSAMVLHQALGLVLAGTVIGLPAGLALMPLLKALLFGVTPHDGLTMLAAIAALLTVGALVGLLPARRASRIDPIVALRVE